MGRRTDAQETLPEATKSEKQAQKMIELHFKKNPKQAPTCYIMIQKGEFDDKEKAILEDRIPDYNHIGQVRVDLLKQIVTKATPSLTPLVWCKVESKMNKLYRDSKFKIGHRLFCYKFGESPDDPLVCRSASLLTDIYIAEHNRKGDRPIVLESDFSINVRANGCYALTGVEQKDGEDVYTKLLHVSGQEAWLRSCLFFLCLVDW